MNDPDFTSETGTLVVRGVCTVCGEGVLRSGEHISGRYEPCATTLGREPVWFADGVPAGEEPAQG